MNRFRVPVPSTRALAIVWSVVGFITVASLIWLGVAVNARFDSFDDVDATSLQERRQLRETVEEQEVDQARTQAALEAVVSQVESLGEKPVVTPAEVQPDGPLPRQLRYVPIPGPAGKDGEDSTVPGPVGPASTVPGPVGPTSTVPGPPGTAGKDGKDGKDGQPGDAGRGIASVACTGGLTPITFTITYSDGSTEEVTCGQLEPVEPDPGPEPSPDPEPEPTE